MRSYVWMTAEEATRFEQQVLYGDGTAVPAGVIYVRSTDWISTANTASMQEAMQRALEGVAKVVDELAEKLPDPNDAPSAPHEPSVDATPATGLAEEEDLALEHSVQFARPPPGMRFRPVTSQPGGIWFDLEHRRTKG